MPIDLQCDTCARKLRVAETLAGKTIKCPHCQSRKLVPGGEEEPVPPPPAAAAVSPRRAAPSPPAFSPGPPAQQRSAPRPVPAARPKGQARAAMPWFMYLIGALPLGIIALAMYHGAIGSGPPWGGSMRFFWLGLALVSILTVTTLGRLPSVPVKIKVGVGLAVGVIDYLVVAVVFLANRPDSPPPAPVEKAERVGQVAPVGGPDNVNIDDLRC